MTKRAEDYLNSLHRETPLQTTAIERKLAELGYPAFPEWLTFHERFAGYWEDLGSGDVAVWGLARRGSVWCGTEEISVNVYDSKPIFIACADAHPSYNYELKPDGTFLVGAPRSESFGIKVERTALFWKFGATGSKRVVYSGSKFPTDKREALTEEMQPYFVREASDKYGSYLMGPTKLVCLGQMNSQTLIVERGT